MKPRHSAHSASPPRLDSSNGEGSTSEGSTSERSTSERSRDRTGPRATTGTSRSRRLPLLPVAFVTASVFVCAIYANLSFTVTNPRNYRFFPPYRAYVNANWNKHLGAEYINIATAMVQGDGFANPFEEKTGPTAWMPPVLPMILAGLLWICQGNREWVMTIVIICQVYILAGTGVLILSLFRRNALRIGSWVAAIIFVLALVVHFRFAFQITHDGWINMLALDLLLAGLCWAQPFRNWETAAGWGIFGGLCALVNPIIGFTWGLLSIAVGLRDAGLRDAGLRDAGWRRLAVTLAAAFVTLTPWAIRNYLVFGRLIPVKSNLVYELYQSQCLQDEGLLADPIFQTHPYSPNSRARAEYKQLGEVAFLDAKKELFRQAVRQQPLDFVRRVGERFLGIFLWYTPFNRAHIQQRPWTVWINRAVHPLPFLACVFLIASAWWKPLDRAQWITLGIFIFYLLPYAAASYYERYALPALGVKVLLVLWASDRLLAFVRRGSPCFT